MPGYNGLAKLAINLTPWKLGGSNTGEGLPGLQPSQSVWSRSLVGLAGVRSSGDLEDGVGH